MFPRFFIGRHPLIASDEVFQLPDGAARHAQVLRKQPGDGVLVFDGEGCEWRAVITEMGRKHVSARLVEPHVNQTELPVQVTLAIGMPSNDRMDFVVEKATELGAYAIQPLMTQRSVLRLDGERALKKVAHWQGVAVAASEQCGRARVPQILPIQTLAQWLASPAATAEALPQRCVLSLRKAISMKAALLRATAPKGDLQRWAFLNGPEGGLSEEEESLICAHGWQAVSLGARTLRADTAPLAALSVIAAHHEEEGNSPA